MSDGDLAPVTPIPLAPRGTPNYACARCGSEWWDTAIVLDGHDKSPTGYSVTDTRCHDCELPLEAIPR